MTRQNGFVNIDGSSAVPDGIVDTSLGAESAVLSEAAQNRLDAFMKGMSTETIKAKYKLEVVFTERSIFKPFFGMVSAFTNGGFAHGGGDEAIYFCPVLVERDGQTRTCSEPLDLRWLGKEIAICPKCKNTPSPKDLVGQIGYKATITDWGKIIARIWSALDGDADIRMGVFSSGSIRGRTEDILNKVSHSAGDKLDMTRGKREWACYPLRNIIKDTSAGADLEKRISAFLGS